MRTATMRRASRRLRRASTAAVTVMVLSSPPSFSATEMTYLQGEVRLAGLLLIPEGPGPTPAVVILQGSGCSDRTNEWARMVAETLADLGVAVLLTDKRGCGSSGGDWKTSTYEDLALDALAGVEALRRMPEFAGSRIGLIGLSQGGRIAPMAASLGEVEFLLNFVGSALPVQDSLAHELEQTYRQHGLGDADIERLQAMTRASFDYLETGQRWDRYLDIRKELGVRYGQAAIASWPSRKDDWYWTFWGGIHDFDPLPHWKTAVEERGIPSFIAYGELDEFDNVPVKESVTRLSDAISSDRLIVKVYPETGHSLMPPGGSMRLVEPLIDDLRAWLAVFVLPVKRP